ncbi:hypothetical protein ANN_18158 [Periplaneta americana]|uniref:Endonuclease-reverse transcriptase n=1 Tax=Periplaneta americana TaxID=6978 RepID=A0ABQ8SPC3_PERAM|nr:hypothetical protein ANN_18158 [Periplaneta americana]
MLGENPQTIRENTGILVEASKEIGLEVNSQKTKYMIMSRDENIVRNGNIKIGNLSFEEVEKLKYLGATVTNINYTREEIKHRINMGNACYYSVEKLLSSSLLSKDLKVRIYKTVILPVVLYGCETWTLTLREEHRLRVFENKVLRKIFGAKRDEVTGEWRKLHNTELHALYSSPDIIRDIKSRRLGWAGNVARMGEARNAYRVLVGRPEEKRPLGRPRRRWEDNIKMDLREVGYDDREWMNLAQDRDQWLAYVRAAMNLRRRGKKEEEWKEGRKKVHTERNNKDREKLKTTEGTKKSRNGRYKEGNAEKNSIKHTTMRVLLFQTIAPGIPLPPQPVVSKSITLLESSKLKLSEALNIVYKVSQTVIQNNNSLISEKVICEAPCKADLNNFKGKIVPGRVSIPGPLVERTRALPLSYRELHPTPSQLFPLYPHNSRGLTKRQRPTTSAHNLCDT